MKRLLFLVLLVIGSFNVRASHLMGGEIVAHYDATLNAYIVTLTHYRDTLGIPQYPTADLYFYQDNGGGNYTLQMTHTIPLNTALSTTLIPNFPYGVEVGVYTDTVTLPVGDYRIVNETCCRNAAILNMTQPDAESMTLYTDLHVDANNNSTPGFLVMPIAHFPINQPAYYNPLPFDPDLDSIAWSLNTPISTHLFSSSFVFNNVVGFTAPAADPLGPFTINPITGEITWTPDTLGNYVQSFEVTEFKNALPTGKIIRDMQYVIVPDNGNSSPFFQSITTYNTNTAQDYKYKYYIPGQQVTFQIMASDADANSLQLTAHSQAFNFANPATFTTFTAGNDVIGTFTWTPPVNFTKDMIVVFRVRDGQFSKDFTLLLRKGDITAVANINGDVNNSITVFPNPVSNKLNVSLDLDKEINGDIALYSSLGQKVSTLYSGKIAKGTTTLRSDIALASGMYYVIVKDNGKAIKTLPVTIQ